MTTALALLSGGLDSTLAIHVIKKQGIDVIALNFTTVFCLCTSKGNCKLEAVKVSEKLGIPVKVINTTRSFLEIVKKPKHGYGKNMNPCIDCRINIFRAAGEYMREIGADFIITGEVLGQRPMSQRKEAMKTIDKEAGLTGLVLRPLCAKHLEPTIPEKAGLVNRDELLEIKGRSRKDQIQLADIFQMTDYPCASGGCLLTDPEFANRIKDSFNHGDSDLNDVKLLKVGRHFRLDDKTKVVVSRRDEENLSVENLATDRDFLLELKDIPGPLAIIRGEINDEKLKTAAQLTARSSKAKSQPSTEVIVSKAQPGSMQRVLSVPPIDPEKAKELMIKKKNPKEAVRSKDTV
jgi:tRNA U34 2-thiouridine synthase MnmA/TrmU